MELLHQGRHTDVFRTLLEDGRPAIVKALRGPYPSQHDRARFERELALTSRLRGPSIIDVLATDEQAPPPATDEPAKASVR